jgi:hypothetical protein
MADNGRIVATFRAKLRGGLKGIAVVPTWAWDLEFMRHFGFIAEEYWTPTDPGSPLLITGILRSRNAADALALINHFLDTPEVEA